MRQWRRLFYYLLINVLVSACTTLVVINLWDRAQNPQAEGFFPFAPPATRAAAATPAATDLAPQGTDENGLADTPEPIFQTYRVVQNDTFESIAQRFGVSVDALLAANGFPASQPLGPGEVLRIPPLVPTPVPEAGLRVTGVLGPGDLASERVVLRQSGDGQVILTGWTLEDMQGRVFSFPILELVNDGSQVEIFTKTGSNTAGRLFWGLSQAVWESGETLVLRDSSGMLRLTYTIP